MITIPFLVNEDAAVKLMLQGMQVTDPNSGTGRKVPVKFWLPEDEVSNLTYPSIIIQPLGWFYAPERQHDGIVQIPYAPEGLETWWADNGPEYASFQPNDSPYVNWFPTAINMDYQITVYTRSIHWHTIPIESQLASFNRLHPRMPHLDIPQDGTKRTCILEAGPERDYSTTDIDGNQKRSFNSNYRLRVFSELLAPYPMASDYGDALVQIINFNLGVDLSIYQNENDLTPADNLFGIIATSSSFGWNTNVN